MSNLHILTFKHFEIKAQKTGEYVFLGISLTDPDQPAISISQVLPPEVAARIAAMLETVAGENGEQA